MKNFNQNNPTLGWTEDEQYDFGKIENKWLKELPRAKIGKRTAGVASLATEPTFSTVEEINIDVVFFISAEMPFTIATRGYIFFRYFLGHLEAHEFF